MADDDNVIRLDLVRSDIEAAKEAPAQSAAAPPAAAKPAGPVGAGGSPGEGGYVLPPDCPVLPLGVHDDIHYYLDLLGQFRALPAEKHGRLSLQALFAEQREWLYQYWPRLNAKGEVVGWRPEGAAEALMNACARRGIWSPRERIRGTGGWAGADGALVLHCGDAVLIAGAKGEVWERPRVIGRWVYPSAAALPRPIVGRAPGIGGPGWELLSILEAWPWARERLDAVLLLGWIGCGLLGAALPWRPVLWVTGGPGTGKSTLRDAVLEPLFDGALVSIADATAAGIWQRLGWSTLAVAVDELEAEADSRKQLNVVKLARLAASGGLVLRGGSDHHEAQFTARSAFLFSSILIPPLLPADRSRIAILELGALGDRPKPAIPPARLGELGRLLRTRLVQGWPRLPALLDWYRAEGWQGTPRLEARACDLYGTLLSVAELLLADDRDELGREPAVWLDLVRREAAQIQGEARDEDECLAHLLSSVVQVSPSDRKTIAQLLHGAAGRIAGTDAGAAQRLLGTYGLRVETVGDTQHLAVANKHQGLALLFSQTHWATRSGSSAPWVQAFRRLAARVGGGPSPRSLWFGGMMARATLLPLAACVPAECNQDGR